MMASQAQFWADGFDIGPSRRMRPMSGEDVDLIEGYYYLERSERYATSEAITTHRDQIALWYRSLTYYNRALDLPRIISSNNLWLPQWRILRPSSRNAVLSRISSTVHFVSAPSASSSHRPALTPEG